MLKRRALATSTVVFGFLVAASCGDSSDTGDGGGGKGTSGDAGQAGDPGGGTAGTGTGGRTGGTGGAVTGGTAGNTSGSGGEPSDGGEPGDGGMPGDGGEPSDGGEPGTGGTMAGSGGAASGAGGMAGKAGGGGSGGGAITCPTIANFDEDWAARVCGKNEDCCAASTPTTCVSDAQAGIIQLYPSLEASIAAGTAQFNCDDYVACMTAVNMASCTNWPKEMSVDFGLPVNEPKCRTFIRGTIASGNGTGAGACTQNYQCIDGYCTDPDGTAGAQVTQCVAFAPTNDTCGTGQPTDVCNPITHFCDASVMPNLCRTRSPNGVACTAANQCESRVCSTTCQPAAPAACPWIPTPPSCSVSNVGAHTGSLGWLAIAGFIGFGAMGRRRRRR